MAGRPEQVTVRRLHDSGNWAAECSPCGWWTGWGRGLDEASARTEGDRHRCNDQDRPGGSRAQPAPASPWESR